MLVEIPVPERCATCEALEAAYEQAVRYAMLYNTHEDDRLYAMRDDAMNDLHAHRRVCRVWQAAHV